MITDAFCELFEAPALAHDAPVTEFQKDIAASIQVVIEEVVLKIAQHLFTSTDCSHLCLAGGVALNCVANGRLLKESPFKDIWIQPAAGDAGGAVGAALEYYYQQCHVPLNNDAVATKNQVLKFQVLQLVYLNTELVHQLVLLQCWLH